MTVSDDTINQRALTWALGDDTGISSEALCTVMTGRKARSNYCHPSDGGDIGRCIRLLDLIPEWRERLPEMGRVSKEWRALAANWAELETLYRAKNNTKLYARMKEILDPIEEKRRDLIKIGPHAKLYFGRGRA